MLHYLKLMVQILLSPQRGWEDVETQSEQPRAVLLRGLLPLIGIAAVTVGLGAFYELRPSATALIIKGVVVFARYALSYFLGVAVLTYTLPRMTVDGLVDREKVELFCAYCVGMMALIGVFENVLPMELTLLQFLPIYVVVVMCLGRKFVDVDERNIFKFAACSITGIIIPVFLIDRILLPAA